MSKANLIKSYEYEKSNKNRKDVLDKILLSYKNTYKEEMFNKPEVKKK